MESETTEARLRADGVGARRPPRHPCQLTHPSQGFAKARESPLLWVTSSQPERGPRLLSARRHTTRCSFCAQPIPRAYAAIHMWHSYGWRTDVRLCRKCYGLLQQLLELCRSRIQP